MPHPESPDHGVAGPGQHGAGQSGPGMLGSGEPRSGGALRYHPISTGLDHHNRHTGQLSGRIVGWGPRRKSYDTGHVRIPADPKCDPPAKGMPDHHDRQSGVDIPNLGQCPTGIAQRGVAPAVPTSDRESESVYARVRQFPGNRPRHGPEAQDGRITPARGNERICAAAMQHEHGSDRRQARPGGGVDELGTIG